MPEDPELRADLDQHVAAARTELNKVINAARVRIITADENLATGHLAEDLMHNPPVVLAAVLAAAAIRLAKLS